MSVEERLTERFFAKAREGKSGCWNWTGALSESRNRRFYGSFWCGGRMVRAARFAYERFNRKIPVGLTVDHLCRNTRCVNPDHLEAVTHKENCLRGTGVSAINARKSCCPKGHPYSGSNLVVAKGRHNRKCRVCLRTRWRLAWRRRFSRTAWDAAAGEGE
jgi:hypothetical protein